MRGRVHARRTLKGLVADLRDIANKEKMKNIHEKHHQKSILGYFTMYPYSLFWGQETGMLHEEEFRVKRKVSESVCLLRHEKYNYC